MKGTDQTPRTDAGGTSPVLQLALVLSLLALVLSAVKLFQKKPAEIAPVTASEQPVEDPQPSHDTPPRRPPPPPTAVRLANIRTPASVASLHHPSASNLWAAAGSPPESGRLLVARLPELQPSWDGLMARAEPLVYYRVSTQHHDELRGDFEQIAGATTVLHQFDAEARALLASIEKDRQDYLRAATAADEQLENSAATFSKRLIELQELYRERKRQYEQESAVTKPQLQDPPAVFERKLALYERAAKSYADDIKRLEDAILLTQKEAFAARQESRGLAGNLNAAFEQSAQDALGQLNTLSNRLHLRIREVNDFIRDYNAKLGQYGSPVGTMR